MTLNPIVHFAVGGLMLIPRSGGGFTSAGRSRRRSTRQPADRRTARSSFWPGRLEPHHGVVAAGRPAGRARLNRADHLLLYCSSPTTSCSIFNLSPVPPLDGRSPVRLSRRRRRGGSADAQPIRINLFAFILFDS
jgi:hypothetical protein